VTNRLPTVTSGAGLYDTWTYNLLPAEEGFSPTTTKLFTRISVLPVEWPSGMNNRPKLAYFESRVGSKFSVTLDKNELSSWTLKTVKRLKAPDEEGLRNLEFFALIFLHNSNSPVDQGTYQLSDKNGFQQILFASPFQQNQMVVTVA